MARALRFTESMKFFCTLVLALVVGACAAPDDTITAPISALEGGELVLPSGDATLNIPAGALAADAEISLERVAVSELPALEDMYASVRIGPAAVTLAEPVSLLWRMPSQVGADASFELHRFDDGAWRALDATITRDEDGSVGTSVTRLGELALVVRTPRGSLRARVIDRTSKVGPRLVGYTIRMRRDGRTEPVGVSDEEGEVSVERLLPGEYEVTLDGDANAIACGNPDWLTQLAVVEPEEESLVVFALDPDSNFCP